MVAYFKRQNNLFMIAGGVLGFLIALLLYRSVISTLPSIARTILIALPVFLGVVLGRIIASRWAASKVRSVSALLFQDGDPEAFSAAFAPILEKTPHQTVEYIDGTVKLAFAKEALGQFDEGLALLENLNPSGLRMHALPARAIVSNQRTRLLLWKEELEAADQELQKLRSLQETAAVRARTLSAQLEHVIRLLTQWKLVMEGGDADEDYLREEIELSKNRIHKAEMTLVLAGALLNRGETEEADRLLLQAAEEGKGLYVGRRAAELLEAE